MRSPEVEAGESVLPRALRFPLALLVPVGVTLLLSPLPISESRDYTFLYLAVVAVLGVAAGTGPAIVTALASFLLVDFFFVLPLHTLTIDDETDLVNLVVLLTTALAVGEFGSRRRQALLRAEQLARDLRAAHVELERLNEEQAKAAAVALRLARTEQQVSLLTETDRLRRDLLANVSHELRTPLGTILTGVTTLAAAPPGEDWHSALALIAGEAQRLRRLVSDMLDLSRIEGNALDLSLGDLDLADAVRAAVARLHLSAHHRSVTVAFEDEELEVQADWDRLGQVLDNLLANADRHSPPDAAIDVTGRRGERGLALISIRDRGPGVNVDLRDRIFERFVHSDTSGGTGLGLAITHGIVASHGGEIWFEDAPGGGAEFTFSIPLAEITSEPSTALEARTER